MKYISVDGATKSTGIALFKDKNLESYDCFTETNNDVFVRIKNMIKKIDNFIQENEDIEYIIFEEVRPEDGKNKKKMHTYKVLMYLQAAAAFMLHDKYPKIQMEFIYPSEWRGACGIPQGSGIKRDTQKIYDIKYVENNFNLKVNDDIANAIEIGLGWFYKKNKGTDKMMF